MRFNFTFWRDFWYFLTIRTLAMKKTITLFALLASITTHGQHLQQLSIYPANPSSTDSVRVIGDLMFFSGGCDLESSNISVNGNQIDVTVRHCPGLLAFICYISDTITLPPLPAGAYSLDFNVLVGTFDFNTGGCTNYSNGGQQSLAFTVAGTNNIPSVIATAPRLYFDDDRKAIVLAGIQKARIRIMDITGRTLFDRTASPGELPVTANSGLLIYSLQLPDGSVKSGRIRIQ
jgi:hypothetical protein